jgi:hypothetical protein
MNKKLHIGLFLLNVVLVGLFIAVDSALSASAYYPGNGVMNVVSLTLAIAVIDIESRYIEKHRQ